MMIAVGKVSENLLKQRIEVIVLAVLICGLIFELIRRKRLMERYAILWLMAGITVLVLALWKGLLTTLAHAAGISYLPSALFAVAFLFVLVMLVHFSMTISRLSDQNTTLAQRLALLQESLGRETVAERQNHVPEVVPKGGSPGAGALEGEALQSADPPPVS